MGEPDTPKGIRPTDEAARALAQGVMAQARFAALGVLDPDSGAPMVSRVAFGLCPQGQPMSLISDLSQHSRALLENPVCSVLVGEPGAKGDPLTHPRLTLQARARFVRHGASQHAPLRAQWLSHHPKAQLYVDFADFAFVLFDLDKGFLNGGFGKAFHLTAADLTNAQSIR